MKLMAWNCRGLGNAPAVRGLLNCQKSVMADVLFLSETKLDEKRMQKFKFKLGMGNMVAVDCEGKGGGIAVLWRSGINVVLQNLSKYHIDVDIKEEDGFEWRFSGIYGESHSDLKHRTWTLLRDLHAQAVKPWMCAGDFNEILFQHEKEGGREKPQSCMDRFKEALEDCGLHDLGFTGDVFTWRNQQFRDDNYIRERLDRAVANMA